MIEAGVKPKPAPLKKDKDGKKQKPVPKKPIKLCKGKTGIFNVWDSNCNGMVNFNELKEGIKSMDLNLDGNVDGEEFIEYYKRH